MHGWRLRIGLIVPADNAVIEPELAAAVPDGVSLHTARLTTEERTAMPADGERMAALLGRLDVGALAYACGETSALAANGGPSAIAERLAAAGGVPAVTATQAVVDALAELGLRRVALVTPYRPAYGADMERCLAAAGLDVVRACHHRFESAEDGGREWHATNLQPPERVYELARAAARGAGADAVVLPATNLRTLPVLDALQRDLGVPALSANGCLLWWCLRSGGLERDARAILGGPR